MAAEFAKIIESIAPPLLISFYKTKIAKYGFFGNYLSWDDAMKASKGYDSEAILDQVKGALLKVRNGEAAYERDSVLFDEIEYSWPLLASLLWIAQQNGNRLSLVDFGGSLGSSYFQNRKFLQHLDELKWNIVEQQHFVDSGKQNFENENVKFYYSLTDCKVEQKADTILFLSTIQYIEKPYALLNEVVGAGFKYIVFDRTPFLEYDDDRITIQKVPPKIYKCDASYPAWFLNKKNFLTFFTLHGYENVAEFNCNDKSYFPHSKFKGFIFRRAACDVK